MLNIDIVIAGIRITFWTDHQSDIDLLAEIFLYHIEKRSNRFNSEKQHDVIIASSKEKLGLPENRPLVWSGYINANTPIQWYNSVDAPENIITIGDDILIRHIPQRKLTICYLSESNALFLKSHRPRLNNYIFFLIHSILPMYGKYCIHASCVAKEEHAYLFLGKSGEGKTTISAILGGIGFEYMGDDLVFISKDEKEGVMVEAFLSKAKLFNAKFETKDSIDVIKDNHFNYCYRKELGAILKLQRMYGGKKSILMPASQAEVFVWLMNSGNNIKIQYNQQKWMDICEKASSIPAHTLMFADKEYFDPVIFDTVLL
ncbi:MAG: hypothetical protein LBU22_11700 [Dysgonamonadaceae bacterium]|jgi:hypothetical protein|nr:hypothetical protein [Dysgonamonadaceae bacterium]